MLLRVWRTCATKSADSCPCWSQPITPPVTTRRPSAVMPLAYPLGAGQPLGCKTRTVAGAVSSFATGNNGKGRPFRQVHGQFSFTSFGG